MRILQLFPRAPWPLKDGGALAFYHHLHGLHENKHQIMALLLNTSKHHVPLAQFPAALAQMAEWKSIDINNHITPLGALMNLFGKQSYMLSRFYHKAFETLISQAIEQHKPELIICESLQTAIYLPFIKSLTKVPVLLRSHNIEFRIWEEQAKVETNPIKAAYLRLQSARLKAEEISLSKGFDGILAITNADKVAYAQLDINTPCLYYPVGFNLKTNLPKNTQHTQGVFHIGSMDWMPNQVAVDFFLEEVWPLVHTQNTSIQFYVAGRNMLPSLRNRKLQGVSILGEVENANEFMLSHGLMVVPLLSGSGMRVKVMEGMALGKCIISTTKGMEGIEAEPGTHYVKANTPQEIAEAILYYHEHPTLADKIGLQARTFAEENYNNTKITAGLNSFAAKLGSQ